MFIVALTISEIQNQPTAYQQTNRFENEVMSAVNNGKLFSLQQETNPVLGDSVPGES